MNDTTITSGNTLISFDVPNLDDTSIEELRLVRAQIDSAVATLGQLKRYAEAKSCAIECRLKGNIALAIRFETIADNLYKNLPGYTRW